MVCYLRAMATIKEATQNAIVFALEALGPDRTGGLQLEEVESANEDGMDVWRITLSMLALDPLGGFNAALSAITHPRRDYKIFTVMKHSGEVKSMKIRELSNA